MDRKINSLIADYVGLFKKDIKFLAQLNFN